MANPVLHESKHILRRVAIGVATGVTGVIVIYFLGFNRGKSEVSEIEMGKNTTKAWKAYVTFENDAQTSFDSSLNRTNRGVVTYFLKYRQTDSLLKEFRRQDSLTSVTLIKNIEELKKTKDIDKEFVILLEGRIGFVKEQMNIAMEYKARFANYVLDSTMVFADKIDSLKVLNVPYNGKMDNIMERMCRSLEDLAGSLSKRYDQSKFAITDFKFYPYYNFLRNKKASPSMPPPVAPPAPDKDKEDPKLPD